MKSPLFGKRKNNDSYSFDDTVEVKVFQNKTNKQFNLPVMKKSTSPQIIKDILGNENVIGLKFQITDVIMKNNQKIKMKGVGKPVNLSCLKGGKA